MCCRFIYVVGLFIISFFGQIVAEESPLNSKIEQKYREIKDQSSVTDHSISLYGFTFAYKATTGTLVLKDVEGKPIASVFYIAYTKDGKNEPSTRPITFCFNGGPGSSSVWLHLGAFGPKRLALNEEGCASPPYYLLDNIYTLLPATDLVFIDPISTGYSRTAPGENAKQFHGVDEDVKSIAEFIRLYTTRNNRWTSPKFLAGESYGTTRAAGLLGKLNEDNHMYFNGVILISSAINFMTYKESSGNDLPYFLYLPTYAATAWYHKMLSPELQKKNLKDLLSEVQAFALEKYSLALLKGDDLNEQEQKELAEQLARYTGLSLNYIEQSDYRIGVMRFAKELLRHDRVTVGRFDSRIKGADRDLTGCYIENDPSFDAVIGGFTAGFNDYVRKDLKWESDEQYHILADVVPWNYGPGADQFLNVGDSLHETILRNPFLRIFVASGYYDLATPYFSTAYTFAHLGLDPKHKKQIQLENYEGGHMMYTQQPSLIRLSQDLIKFIRDSSNCQ